MTAPCPRCRRQSHPGPCCRVCLHPAVVAINAALESGTRVIDIYRRYEGELSEGSLYHHRQNGHARPVADAVAKAGPDELFAAAREEHRKAKHHQRETVRRAAAGAASRDDLHRAERAVEEAAAVLRIAKTVRARAAPDARTVQTVEEARARLADILDGDGVRDAGRSLFRALRKLHPEAARGDPATIAKALKACLADPYDRYDHRDLVNACTVITDVRP